MINYNVVTVIKYFAILTTIATDLENNLLCVHDVIMIASEILLECGEGKIRVFFLRKMDTDELSTILCVFFYIREETERRRERWGKKGMK